MKKNLLLLLVLLLGASVVCAQSATSKIPHTHSTRKVAVSKRTEIIVPQVNGYNCYKGDFHIHTTYSDGRVNPAGRVIEAWEDGLDIIAITDHYEGRSGEKRFLKVIAPYSSDGKPMEYQPAKTAGAIKADFNAIHQEAVDQLNKSGYPMLLIKGCEMARNAKTHGHFNALFLENINTVYNADMKVAFEKVREQGGIVIHNHPAWRRKTSDKTEFHESVYGANLISGVEVANGYSFYPHIVRRCIDEKLAMFGNTDVHGFTSGYAANGDLRTMTLVFAKNLTEKAVKEAILKRRTLVYSGGDLIGEESWLKGLLNASIDCRMVKEDAKKGVRTYQLTNHSSFSYHFRRGKTTYELQPFKTVLFTFGKNKKTGEYLPPRVRVENMWIADYKHPTIELELDK